MAGKFTVVLRFDGDGRAAGLSVHRSQRERERESKERSDFEAGRATRG